MDPWSLYASYESELKSVVILDLQPVSPSFCQQLALVDAEVGCAKLGSKAYSGIFRLDRDVELYV